MTCTCKTPYSSCPNASETLHGDYYCRLSVSVSGQTAIGKLRNCAKFSHTKVPYVVCIVTASLTDRVIYTVDGAVKVEMDLDRVVNLLAL